MCRRTSERTAQGLWDVDDQYPGIFWDYYFEEPAGGVTYPDRIGRSLGPFNPGIWSGNIMSDPTLRVSAVEDLNANGFSTLTAPIPSRCDWKRSVGASRIDQGWLLVGPTWRIVVKRTLATNDPNDVQSSWGRDGPCCFRRVGWQQRRAQWHEGYLYLVYLEAALIFLQA